MKASSDRLDGIFLLDKPIGSSSHYAMKRAQRLFQAKKGGHTGSLDPLATGMLPLCFGEATKFSRFFLEANKGYVVRMQLGITTTTGDSEGEALVSRPIPSITEHSLIDLKHHFSGTHQQIPPMYSALKHQGKPLYQLAREGKSIERPPRTVTIFQLEFDPLTHQAEGVISFFVECSKGTYIRSLVEQMGEYLGCGAHVIALRRTWVEPFRDAQMTTLVELEALSLEERRSKLLTIPTILAPIMPALSLSSAERDNLLKGRVISLSPNTTGWVSLMCSGEFLGIGEMDPDGLVQPKRLIEHIP